jgi:cytochrome c peroxidase
VRALVLLVLAACGADAPTGNDYEWSLPAGMPTPRVPTDNPMSADKALLGRHLFYDTRLSGDGSQSCASCHRQAQAFSDGRVTSVGITGEAGRHNSMSLGNVAYNASSTWAAHVVRLEDQAMLPMFGTAPVELGLAGVEDDVLARLGSEPIYAELFPRAFDDGLTIENVTRALASFERTMISGRSRFDRFIAGEIEISAPAQRGLALFESERLGCATCHGGFNFTSSFDHEGLANGARTQFFNTGLYNVDGSGAYPANDRGLVEVTGDPRDMGRFRAPTLRNISVTAPYFHDGSAATLDDVIDHYARGGVASPLKSPLVSGFTLTADERAELHAFLASLTDEPFLTDPALANPW